jgi:uncharacterized protein
METTLTDFVRVLRNAEVRVSPAETLDAVRALEIMGYADRARVREALAATLTKTIEEKQLFDECFERFFKWRGAADNQQPGDHGQTAPGEPSLPVSAPAGSADQATASLGGALSELSEMLLAGDAAQLALAVDAAGRSARIGEMRMFTQRGLYGRRILEALGWDALQRDILTLEQAPAGSDPGRASGLALKQQADLLRERVKDFVENRYLLFASGNARELRESVLRTARLSNLERQELARMNRLVRRIARKLAARYARRKRSFRRGLLDVPRTLRGGIAHDGLLFEPRWKSVRRDRPALIAVCDVSGSVRAYARFLLLFLYGLSDVLPRVRSFVFSSKLGEVSELFEHNPPEAAIEIALKQWGFGSTDYGAALRELLPAIGRELERGATVVVLGDGRNNYGDPALQTLRELGSRCRRLVWLNPEALSSWGTGDSEMLRYRACVSDARVVQSLAHLERFADDLLRNPAW